MLDRFVNAEKNYFQTQNGLAFQNICYKQGLVKLRPDRRCPRWRFRSRLVTSRDDADAFPRPRQPGWLPDR